MKQTLYLIAIIVCTGLVSCKKEPQVLDANYIPVNNCKTFTVAQKTITICLDSVTEDSRCPIKGICIWEGVAVGRFTATTEDGEQQNFTLSAIHKIAGYNNETEVDGFKIDFVNLSPSPELEHIFSYNEYLAEMKVTRP